MKRQIVFASSIVLALASATSFATTADAAHVKHHGGGNAGHHAASHHAGGHGHGRRGGGGGWGGGYYGGYYDNVCGPIQLTLGLCGPFGL